MLYVDSRIGSKELAGSFTPWSIPTVTMDELPADFMFEGNGPQGIVSIGIERKKLSDILACIRDGRFSGHQLIGLLEHYHRVVLLIEGMWRPGQDGALEEFTYGKWRPVRGKFVYRELTAYLTTMREICGLQIERTSDEFETVNVIAGLYKWYQKPWADHSGHKIMHNAPIPTKFNLVNMLSEVKEPPAVQRIANQLPGVAGKKSLAVAQHFRSVVRMVMAIPEEWECIDGIGKKLSHEICDVLNHEIDVPDQVREVSEFRTAELLRKMERARLRLDKKRINAAAKITV